MEICFYKKLLKLLTHFPFFENNDYCFRLFLEPAFLIHIKKGFNKYEPNNVKKIVFKLNEL